jgi:hypothetical protein
VEGLLVAALHHFDEEQDPDPDPHQSNKSDPNPHQSEKKDPDPATLHTSQNSQIM